MRTRRHEQSKIHTFQQFTLYSRAVCRSGPVIYADLHGCFCRCSQNFQDSAEQMIGAECRAGRRHPDRCGRSVSTGRL